MDDRKAIRIEFDLRVLDVPHDGKLASREASQAMFEISDAMVPILEKYGLTYLGIGMGIPRQ